MVESFSSKIAFIQSIFGAGDVRADGNITVKCPFCEDNREDKRKLAIRLQDDANHCWVCGWRARSLLPILRKYAPERVQDYKVVNPIFIDGGPKDDTVVPLALPLDYRFLATATDDFYTTPMKGYLKARGIGIREMWRWKLGCSMTDRWRDRIMIPSFDRNGDINFITSRAIDDRKFRKYENCDAPKNEVVFDEMNIDWKKELVLVEGPFDLLKCRMNATCLLGSGLSEISLLHDKILLHSTPVVLMLDSDMGGKTMYLAKRLASYGITVRGVFLEDGDPGSMSPAAVERAVKDAVEMNDCNMLRLKLSRTIDVNSGSSWRRNVHS